MQKRFRVCSISIPYAERSKEENLRLALDLVERASCLSPDIICLPELLPFIGVPIEQALGMATSVPGEITDIFAEICRKKKLWISAGTFERSGSKFCNSCFILDDTGQLRATYRKMFPTIGELEHNVLPGEETVVLDTPWGPIGFATCFDLNFEHVMDALGQKGARLVFFPTFFHGGAINTSWCIRNSYYIVSAKVMGEDGRGGMIVDPLGRVIKTASMQNPIICEEINLDFVVAHTGFNEKQLKAVEAYSTDVSVELAAPEERVLIISRIPEKSAAEIANEFSVELLKDLLNRASKLRDEKRRQQRPEVL